MVLAELLGSHALLGSIQLYSQLHSLLVSLLCCIPVLHTHFWKAILHCYGWGTGAWLGSVALFQMVPTVVFGWQMAGVWSMLGSGQTEKAGRWTQLGLWAVAPPHGSAARLSQGSRAPSVVARGCLRECSSKPGALLWSSFGGQGSLPL